MRERALEHICNVIDRAAALARRAALLGNAFADDISEDALSVHMQAVAAVRSVYDSIGWSDVAAIAAGLGAELEVLSESLRTIEAELRENDGALSESADGDALKEHGKGNSHD